MNLRASRLLDMLVEHLDIPKSLYDKAAARHRSLAEFLHRKGSRVAAFDPDVRPQGSFRYGTVIRPLNPAAEYDLDNVCVLQSLKKSSLTQRELKGLYGEEIKAYALAHNFEAPLEEHNRCWRLQYADEVSFHLDTLPCVPEDPQFIQQLVGSGVDPELARRAVAITDRKHPEYEMISSNLFSSNPRGFARWFELKAELGRKNELGKSHVRAAIEDVPPYDWKTTLQRGIQILKRHRDVMFVDCPELAPISMIITNLAAMAYTGETDVLEALRNILLKMPGLVRTSRPRVPNPTNPFEDYAEKWTKDPRLEQNFWKWHAAAKSTIENLPSLLECRMAGKSIGSDFRIDLSKSELDQVEPPARATPSNPTTPLVSIPASVPKPWGTHA